MRYLFFLYFLFSLFIILQHDSSAVSPLNSNYHKQRTFDTHPTYPFSQDTATLKSNFLEEHLAGFIQIKRPGRNLTRNLAPVIRILFYKILETPRKTIDIISCSQFFKPETSDFPIRI